MKQRKILTGTIGESARNEGEINLERAYCATIRSRATLLFLCRRSSLSLRFRYVLPSPFSVSFLSNQRHIAKPAQMGRPFPLTVRGSDRQKPLDSLSSAKGVMRPRITVQPPVASSVLRLVGLQDERPVHRCDERWIITQNSIRSSSHEGWCRSTWERPA